LLVVRHVEITARQLSAADEDRRGMLFERIALDIQRSLDNFDRIYSACHWPIFWWRRSPVSTASSTICAPT
jgi:hypothetical protein